MAKAKDARFQKLARLAVEAGVPSQGGRARAKTLSSSRRRAIAIKAARARWARMKNQTRGRRS